MQVKPPKRVSGRKFPTTKIKYENQEWTCSSCLTNKNIGPFCKKCSPEECRKWKEEHA